MSEIKIMPAGAFAEMARQAKEHGFELKAYTPEEYAEKMKEQVAEKLEGAGLFDAVTQNLPAMQKEPHDVIWPESLKAISLQIVGGDPVVEPVWEKSSDFSEDPGA